MAMDPPEPELDGFEEIFLSIVASQVPPSSSVPSSSRFVKRSEIPDVKLSSATSKRKSVTLSEK